jgi:hypothetical protein
MFPIPLQSLAVLHIVLFWMKARLKYLYCFVLLRNTVILGTFHSYHLHLFQRFDNKHQKTSKNPIEVCKEPGYFNLCSGCTVGWKIGKLGVWFIAGKEIFILCVGVSKRFETGSLEHQPMAVCECVHCDWERGMSPLSMPSGVAVWTLGVTQHQCLSPCVPACLRFQHGR